MAKGFDKDKMQVLREKSLGSLNGWNGETIVVAYRYDSNPVAVKVINRGAGRDGKEFEYKIHSFPLDLLRSTIIPALQEVSAGL